MLAVSSTGISKRKAYYSDYGNGYVDLAAPGGDVYDTADNTRDVTKAILAAFPEQLAQEPGLLDANGEPLPGSGIVRNCAPRHVRVLPVPPGHVDGVAARDRRRRTGRRQVGLPRPPQRGQVRVPGRGRVVLRATATNTPCPTPPAFTYTRILPTGETVTATHTCEGTRRQQRVLRRRHRRRRAGRQGLLSPPQRGAGRQRPAPPAAFVVAAPTHACTGVEHRARRSAVEFATGDTGDEARAERAAFREILRREGGTSGHGEAGCLEREPIS